MWDEANAVFIGHYLDNAFIGEGYGNPGVRRGLARVLNNLTSSVGFSQPYNWYTAWKFGIEDFFETSYNIIQLWQTVEKLALQEVPWILAQLRRVA